MDERELVRFRIEPPTALNYHAWSNDIKIALAGKGLWKLAGDDVQTSTSQVPIEMAEEGTSGDHATAHVSAQRSKDMAEAERQKCDLALACIVTSIDHTCRAMIRAMRCSREVWKTLKVTFQTVSEASIDAKLTQLQEVKLAKSEIVVEYLSRIFGAGE